MQPSDEIVGFVCREVEDGKVGEFDLEENPCFPGEARVLIGLGALVLLLYQAHLIISP